MTGYTRPVQEWTEHGEPFPAGYSELVTVITEGTRRYEVVLDGEGNVGELTVAASPVSQREIEAIPLATLREVAAGHRVQVNTGFDADGLRLSDALDDAERQAGDLELDGDAPSPKDFAAQWNATPRAVIVDGEKKTRRHLLAKHYGKTEWTIDKWSRRARDLNLITKDKSGAPRRSTSDNKEQE